MELEKMNHGPEDEEEVEDVEEENEDIESLDFESLFGTNETDDAEPEEEEEEPEEEEVEEEPVPRYDPDSGTWLHPESGEKMLSQSEVNQLLGNSRIKGREYEDNIKQLEAMTGMSFAEITDFVRQEQVQKMHEKTGLPQEEAAQYIEDRQARSLLEKELLDIRYNQQLQQAQMQYNNEKSQYINNPLVKQYEQEIDAIAKGGQNVSWTVAMNHVLGQKAVGGELTKSIQETARKKAPKAGPKIAPESGGGSIPAEVIPKEVAFFANALGENPKESYDEYKKMKKQK